MGLSIIEICLGNESDSLGGGELLFRTDVLFGDVDQQQVASPVTCEEVVLVFGWWAEAADVALKLN